MYPDPGTANRILNRVFRRARSADQLLQRSHRWT